MTMTYSSNFKDNILDRYDLPTYHFKLFMISEKDFISINNDVGQSVSGMTWDIGDDVTKVILAETGVTTYRIENVEIMSTAQMSDKQNGNGTALTARFNIVEPFGATLMDKIVASAASLNISNCHKCPFFLELSFKGNTIDTSTPTTIGGVKWVWPLSFLTMDMNIGTAGSTYMITSSIYTSLPQSTSYGVIHRNFSVLGGNVGSFFNDLQQNLNDDERNKFRSYTPSTFNRWIFDIDPDLATQSFSELDPTKNSNLYTRDDKEDVGFSDGTGILNIIDSIMIGTPLIQKRGKNTSVKDGTTTDDLATFKQLYKVFTDVRVTGFDQIANDYTYDFIYHVRLNDYATPIINVDEPELARENSQKRFEDMVGNAVLSKHYQYLFTGNNIHIQDMDLKMNLNWFVGLPYNAGYNTNYASYASGKNISIESQSNAELFIRSSNVQKFRSSLGGTKFVQTSSGLQLDTKNNSVKSKELDLLDIANKLNVQVNAGDTASSILDKIQLENDKRVQDPETFAALQAKINWINDRQDRTQGVNTSFNTSVHRYVEQYTQKDINDTNKNMFSNATSESIPITFKQVNEDYHGMTGVQSFDPGRMMISSMFTQIKSGTNNALLSLNLQIKGDPFWLAPYPIDIKTGKISNVLDQLISEKSKNGSSIGSAPFKVGENFFLFTMQTPDADVMYDSDTRNFSSKTIINGLYTVLKVESKFDDGKFTQTLICVRDPMTDVTQIDIVKDMTQPPKAVVNNSKVVSSSTSPTTLLPKVEPLKSVGEQFKEKTDKAKAGMVLIDHVTDISTDALKQHSEKYESFIDVPKMLDVNKFIKR